MRKIYPVISLFLISICSSCQLLADVFKAGIYTGIILVVIILAIIIWVFFKFCGRE